MGRPVHLVAFVVTALSVAAAAGCAEGSSIQNATGGVMAGMEEKGIPPFVLAFAVMIALLLLPALLGG